MNEMIEVPQQNIDTPKSGVGPTGIPAVETNLALTNDTFAEDMAKLAAQANPVTEPTTPTMPEQPVNQAPVTPEATKVEVPEKFKTPDGNIDVAKVEKSLASAEEMLAKYLEVEKAAKRKMNEAKRAEHGLTPEQTADMANIQVDPAFAAAFEKDVQTIGLGAAIIRLNTATVKAAEEAAYARATKDIEGLKEVASNQTSRAQIEAIGKNDPWVYTPEGVSTLTGILDSQPYLRNASDPYKAAYIFHKGQNVASQPVSQVFTPNPMAKPTAPVPSGIAVTPVNTQTLRLDSRDAIEAHLKKLKPAEQVEFYKKLGFPSF